MTDFLDTKNEEIKARIAELKPLVEESTRLEEALAALDGITANGDTPAEPETVTAAAKPKRKRSSRAKSGAKRGRPKGTGTRGAEALKIITENPGLNAKQIAAKMGIRENYLYRLLPGIPELRKDEETKGWHLREGS